MITRQYREIDGKPLPFSGAMVRARRAGRKTETRRVIVPQPPVSCDPGTVEHDYRCPQGAPGDLCYIREVWMCVWSAGYAAVIQYRADEAEIHWTDLPRDVSKMLHRSMMRWMGHWRPPKYHPKAIARDVVRLTAVRPERLQDIAENGARREGACRSPVSGIGHATYRRDFEDLWDSINAKRAGGAYMWERNPWVWVEQFEETEL